MIFIFYFFAVLLVFLSWKSFRGGINYLRYFKSELAKPAGDFTPFASIIAPCRGVDENLKDNLNALFRQNYPAYEVIFVVDDAADDCVSIINRLISENCAVAAKLVIAPDAVDASQKIENLREAVLHISDASETLVFVDSDARPAENWLRYLVAPLRNEKIGAATGYRWFISEKISFASELRSVWNASIASALGANAAGNFCWGGSTAMRRETFDRLGIRDAWRGTASDDFVITRTLQQAHLPIYFVPQALTATIESCRLSECLEFTNRQMKITRVYAANLWIQSFIGSGLFTLVWMWGIGNLLSGAADAFAVRFSLAALILTAAFSVGKSHLRLKAVRLALKNHDARLRRQVWTQNVLWLLTPALFFGNCLCAAWSRRIVWRGISYELVSSRETKITRARRSNDFADD